MNASDFKRGDKVSNSYGAKGVVTGSSAGIVQALYRDRAEKGKRDDWTETYDPAWFAKWGDAGMLRKIA